MYKNITKHLIFFKQFLIIILIVVIFDLLINFFLSDEFKKRVGVARNYLLHSKKYHHVIAPNINVYNYWNEKKYKVITNRYSHRSLNVDEIYSEKGNNNIIFIGDSFVWGTGIDYKDHFIKGLNQDKFNYINISYESYSPSIYFKKIENIVIEKKMKFKKIFLFVDSSDIQDEGYFYREDLDGNIVRQLVSDEENELRYKKYIIKNYLKQNSFIYKIFDILIQNPTPDNTKKCITTPKENKDYFKYLNQERFLYSIDKNLQKTEWVKKGISKIEYYLNKIKIISEINNIELILVIYPSALEVLKNTSESESLHYTFLKKWSIQNNIKFLNLYDEFMFTDNPNKNYLNSFIPCDVHWNSNGHKIISQKINKTLIGM